MLTIYLDFDNTMVESNQKVIEILNNRYHIQKTEADLTDYGFHSIQPISEEEKLSIFESDEFFENLQLKPQFLDILSTYYSEFKWVVVTHGTRENLRKKNDWIKKNIPYKLDFFGFSGNGFGKTVLDMSDGIQIDDNVSCINESALVKILYKSYNNFPWQQFEPGEELVVVNNWQEIAEILQFYSQIDVKTLEKRS